MGIYIQSGKEIKDKFENFLQEITCEGDVPAQAIADAWNIIAEEQEWNDRLKVK